VVTLGKLYLGFVVVVLLVYMFRHYLFTLNRLFHPNRPDYHDIVDSHPPPITVLIPMHNEEQVAAHILEALLASDYPRDHLQIIPIDDRSTDKTFTIIEKYARRDPRICPYRRSTGNGGKPAALQEAIPIATGEILFVFDADYIPSQGLLRELAAPFADPQVGAVMGRVVPINTDANLLTRLLDLERSAGYQVDQQARHNLRLIPQYGGTVGGFRKTAFEAVGGFDPEILTEDTELTFRLSLAGWKVDYINRCECYEEVPETWRYRIRQIRRWAIGHTQCLFRFAPRVLTSPELSLGERVDGLLLLSIYLVAPLLTLTVIDAVFLFFAGEIDVLSGLAVILGAVAFNSLGNFASFFEIGAAVLLDGSRERVRLLPLNLLNSVVSTLAVTEALLTHAARRIFGNQTPWHKTARFRVGTLTLP
jgi:cellulose synthase/poly-beta-1,6-N-acetylglucosamine synthase-like glycosyltransferase